MEVDIPVATVANNPPPAPPSPPAPVGPRRITSPKWIKRPNGNDFARYYPSRAQEREREGKAVLDCTVRADGTIACSVASEDPPGWGFGDAAVKISRSFQIAPKLEDGEPSEGGRITVPLSFKLAKE